MLANLVNLVKEYAGKSITNNPAIPDQQNDAAVQEAGSSILDTLKTALAAGNIKEVIGMFTGGQSPDAQNPLVQQATGNFTGRLQEKFGLDPVQANDISSELVPSVMGKLSQKVADPADSSFDLQGILNQLSGGKTSGMDISSLVNKFKGGLDKDGDGDVDFQDLKTLFAAEGSMMDKVKGIFG